MAGLLNTNQPQEPRERQSLLGLLGLDMSDPSNLVGMQMIANGLTPSIGSPRNPFEGVPETMAMGQQMQLRQQEAQHQQQERQRAEQERNLTYELMQREAPDIAEMVRAGMPMQAAFSELMRRRQGPPPLDPFTLSPGQTRFGPDGMPVASVPDSGPNLTTDIQEFEYAREHGFEGGFTDFQTLKRQSGAMNLNIGPNGQPFATPPFGQDYRRNSDGTVWTDDQGRPQVVNAIGGPQDMAAQQAETQGDRAITREENLGTVVIQDMDEAMRMIDQYGDSGLETWLRARLADVEGTRDYDLNELLTSAGNTISLQALQEMKEVTGAGLGNVSDRQSAMLSQAYGSIAIGQNKQQLMDSVARVRNMYLDIIYGRGRGPERSPFRGQPWQPVAGTEWVDDNGRPIPWDEVDAILGPPEQERHNTPSSPGGVVDYTDFFRG